MKLVSEIKANPASSHIDDRAYSFVCAGTSLIWPLFFGALTTLTLPPIYSKLGEESFR